VRDPRIRRLRHRKFAGVSRGRLPHLHDWLQERIAALADTGTPIEFSVAPALDGSFICVAEEFKSGDGPIIIGSDADGVPPVSFSADSYSWSESSDAYINDDGSSVPAGMLILQQYWIERIDASSFFLYALLDGMKDSDNRISPLDVGSGHLYIMPDASQSGLFSLMRQGVKSLAIQTLTTIDNMLGLLP